MAIERDDVARRETQEDEMAIERDSGFKEREDIQSGEVRIVLPDGTVASKAVTKVLADALGLTGLLCTSIPVRQRRKPYR